MTVPKCEPSPWGGFDVYVIPDDDAAAQAAGWSDELLKHLVNERVIYHGTRLFVRATPWQRIKVEFKALGALQ